MNIVISAQTQKLLEEQMKRGGFANPDEAVRTALESWGELALEELDEETSAAIEQGLAEADRGEGRPWQQVREQLKAKYPAE